MEGEEGKYLAESVRGQCERGKLFIFPYTMENNFSGLLQTRTPVISTKIITTTPALERLKSITWTILAELCVCNGENEAKGEQKR